MASRSDSNLEAIREGFYERLDPLSMAPLWKRLRSLIPAEPEPKGIPYRWSYATVRPFLMESAELISAKEAERRVLLMENPGLEGTSQITNTIYAGYQLIMPGEVAPAHRHSQSALRFLIEGQGAYTAVDGEKTPMEPGDFVITPAWTWHDHGHDGTEPVVWLDGLDIPMVARFDATFREEYEADESPITRPVGDALARYGSGMLPIGYTAPSLNSPVFNYPYARTREVLEALTRASAPDEHHGHLMRYVNPVNGGWAMPTIATTMRLIPKGFTTKKYRATSGSVHVVVEGTGKIHVGGESFDVAPHDVTAAPNWTWYGFEAETDLIVFSYSDRVAQEKLGFFREQLQ
ncbi:MAG: gentisate 1,2-dioxygenase [Stutzerimonas stutzeri]|nr:MAG: gentisate 1,2-dioxygenase [Stutzerimonas stutzeri]